MLDEALRLTGIDTLASKKREPSPPNLQVISSTRDNAMADSDNVFETVVSVQITGQLGSDIASASEYNDVKGDGTAGKVLPAEVATTGKFQFECSACPNLPRLLARTVGVAHVQGTHLQKKQRVGVGVVCGPASMLHDTRNAAALVQARLFGGEIEELYLHSEPFVEVFGFLVML
ncbi:hypothetical protein PENVUL_c002G04199 [Penicillium vulpinum]|uniref:Uncharacterized protein n=2 Tax=Penicillium vulpinum TaxID=29845 RepID=A0A1V6SD51_9EURO|nr:hypothetical protein PENVUL_c002G04199 [Penicillium vulpinum]